MRKILFVGDSHAAILAAPENKNIYTRDITINKFRKNNGDVYVKYSNDQKFIESSGHLDIYDVYDLSDDDESKVTLSKLIDDYTSDFVLFSIGEIDVRFHLPNFQESAIVSLLQHYEEFLSKIKYKKIIVCSIPPPGTEKNLEIRKKITKDMNRLLSDMCDKNSYGYFDPYSDFNKDGYLDASKSDGSVHIHPSYKGQILSNLMNFIDKNYKQK